MSVLLEFSRTTIRTFLTYAWWAKVETCSRIGAAKKADASSSRNALLLAWALPPAVGGGVYRPTSFLKYGPKFGWKISAIAGPYSLTTHEAGRYLLKSIPEEVRIHRLDRSSLKPSWRFFPRVDGGFVNALATAQQAFRNFKDDPPGVVIASGPPFHNFIAARYIAKFFGAKLVLDYRDEWTESPLDFVELGSMDRLSEPRCLHEATAVAFTTHSQLEHQIQAFSFLQREKCYVISNGWEPADFNTTNNLESQQHNISGKHIISYVGSLNSYTKPCNFIDVLGKVLSRRDDLRQCIELHFIGDVPSSFRQGLAEFPIRDELKFVSHVPKPMATQIMQESNALLILAEPELERYRPGKLYDYIASGTPILVYGHAGEASRLVEQLDVGTFVSEGDVDGLEKWLDQLVKEPPQRSADQAERNSWLEQHTREALARRFFDIIESL